MFFSEELKGMTPERDVEFLIQLESRTASVSKPPYNMAPPELEEMKKQLTSLLEKVTLDLVLHHGVPSYVCHKERS